MDLKNKKSIRYKKFIIKIYLISELLIYIYMYISQRNSKVNGLKEQPLAHNFVSCQFEVGLTECSLYSQWVHSCFFG